jgi:hypothetical protein
VQFHPEFDAALVETYVDGPGVRGYLRAGGCDPDALVAEAPSARLGPSAPR